MSATRDTSISGGERFEKQNLKEAGVARSQISAYSNSTPNAGVSIQKMRARIPQRYPVLSNYAAPAWGARILKLPLDHEDTSQPFSLRLRD